MREGFLFSTSSPKFIVCGFITDSHAFRCGAVPHCAFVGISLVNSDVRHLFVCLWAICMSSTHFFSWTASVLGVQQPLCHAQTLPCWLSQAGITRTPLPSTGALGWVSVAGLGPLAPQGRPLQQSLLPNSSLPIREYGTCLLHVSTHPTSLDVVFYFLSFRTSVQLIPRWLSVVVVL